MSDFTPVRIDYNLITNATNAQIALRTSSLTSSSQVTQRSSQATAELEAGAPPWETDEEMDVADASRAALSTGKFIPDDVAEDALEADDDSSKLFAIYDALQDLEAIAQGIIDDEIDPSLYGQAEDRFTEGLTEIDDFLNEADFESVNVIGGEHLTSAQTDVSIERQKYEYVTSVVHEGALDEPVEEWAGLQGFTIDYSGASGVVTQIDIDLTTLSDEERTMQAVVDLINTELESAGATTRFEAVKIGVEDEDGEIEGDNWAFKIAGTQTETLSFSAADEEPAVYLAGTSGDFETHSGQLAKYTDLDEAEPTRVHTQKFEADAPPLEGEDDVAEAPPNTRITATETAAGGSIYALVETEGAIDGQTLRSESDVALVKYDSAGKEIWSRVLGSTTETEGLALAVSDNGDVAIAGVTNGDLTEDAVGGGEDGFVTVYNSDGVEQYTRQHASGQDDRIEAIAFDSDGSLYIAGRTEGSVGGSNNLGGEDGYIEKLDPYGTSVWQRQTGGSGDDTITALAVDENGGVVAASLEDGETVLRRYGSDTDEPDDWSYNLGAGVVRDIDVEGDAVYIAGDTRLDGETNGVLSGTAQADTDGFAMRLDVDNGEATENWFTRFDGEGDQSAPAIEVYNGDVYVAGSGATGFGSAEADGDKNAYVAKLDAETGAEDWATTLGGRGDVSSATDIAIDPTGASTLDAFGLPSGEAEIGDVNHVTDRTAARPGDHFYVAVDGGKKTKITIEAGDTYRDLTFKINAALVLDGTAEIRSSDGEQSLRITPAEDAEIELIPGAEGQDALSALGLASGVLYKEPFDSDNSEDSSSDAPELVSLDLDFNMEVNDKESAEEAIKMIESAERAIRQAHRIVTEDPTLDNLTQDNGSSGEVSPYVQSQLANYQAGLDRLTGGTGVVA